MNTGLLLYLSFIWYTVSAYDPFQLLTTATQKALIK